VSSLHKLSYIVANGSPSPQAGLVLDRNYNVCFTPLPFNLQKYAMFMKNLEICVSGYTKDERKHIGNFVSLMGAQFVVTLKAKTTTHLICKTPSGDKYESALNRNIKVVRKEWLDECAKRVCNPGIYDQSLD
jgi:NAD-dependent DNA ligase